MPNAGISAKYRDDLQDVITKMATDVVKVIKSIYGRNPPEMAQDELPAAALRRAMRQLKKKWLKNFDKLGPELAEWFSVTAAKRSDAQLMKMLRDRGFTVKFKISRGVRDVLKASIEENVSLIKSIPQKFFTDIEGSVYRSVQRGGDLQMLTKDLQKHYGVSFRRAALIARDQNIKATSAINTARQVQLGITQAIWKHSHAGRVPRPTHVAMNNKVYDVAKGMWDEHEQKWVQPGSLINCRCTSKSIIPGLPR